MYPQIPWELVADPLGFAKRTLGTSALENPFVELKHTSC
jgi:hypothetical protein